MKISRQAFLADSYSFLNKLVIKLARDDIPTVEALLIEMTGSTNAYLMFNKLLYWWKISKNPQKWVYKSWRDWQKELRLSRDQSQYVHATGRLESVGVERRRVQVPHKGTPIHYRLHFKSFLRALAKFAGVSVMTILKWMGEGENKEENSASGNAKTPLAKHKITSSIKLQKNNVVIENLPSISGMKIDLVQILVEKFGSERVQAMLNYGIEQGANNIAGFVIKGLHENWEISNQKKPNNQWNTAKNPYAGLSFSDFAG